MKRTLYIIRHGKSSWDTIVGDVDRPLTERGVRNCYEMAELISDSGIVPEAVFSSTANRALHTAIIMSRIWELKDEAIKITSGLYLPEIIDIEQTAMAIDDEIGVAALFGHNPGFTQFANRYFQPQLDNIPTAGFARLELELEKWSDLPNATLKNAHFEYPKKYKD